MFVILGQSRGSAMYPGQQCCVIGIRLVTCEWTTADPAIVIDPYIHADESVQVEVCFSKTYRFCAQVCDHLCTCI